MIGTGLVFSRLIPRVRTMIRHLGATQHSKDNGSPVEERLDQVFKLREIPNASNWIVEVTIESII